MPDARTALTDLIDPEILADMTAEETLNMLVQLSGVDNTDKFAIGTKGSYWEIPYFDLIGDYERIVEGTDLTEQKFTASRFGMPSIARGAVYSIYDLAQLKAYGDPMAYLARAIAQKNLEVLQKTRINILEGAIPTANRKDYSGTGNMCTAAVNSAKIKLGDKSSKLKFILMHSTQFQDAQTADDIIYQPASQILPLQAQTNFLGAQTSSGMVATISGLICVVSDDCKKVTGTPNKYASYLLTEGAMGFYWRRTVNIDLDRNTKGKYDIISPDIHFVMCLNGVSWTKGTADTDANLADTTKYTLKWNQKNVGAVRLYTAGSV